MGTTAQSVFCGRQSADKILTTVVGRVTTNKRQLRRRGNDAQNQRSIQ